MKIRTEYNAGVCAGVAGSAATLFFAAGMWSAGVLVFCVGTVAGAYLLGGENT